MKLYVTPGSPYGRMARIVVLEKSLEERVEVILARTRTPGSPYYEINPSGRVPYLQLDDGSGLEESGLICWYLDHLDGAPAFDPPPGLAGLETRRLEAMARSLLDGISLWGREYLYRAPEIRSETIIAHERSRAFRLVASLEGRMDSPALAEPLDMAQLTLACALHWRSETPPGFAWRDGAPQLAGWVDRIGTRPSLQATLAPPR